MKSYRGMRTFDGREVTVDGQALDPRYDLKTFSRNGFEWGFEGREPRQLALAILADAAGDGPALEQAEAFMHAIVANFDNEWEMTQAQVEEALDVLSRR